MIEDLNLLKTSYVEPMKNLFKGYSCKLVHQRLARNSRSTIELLRDNIVKHNSYEHTHTHTPLHGGNLYTALLSLKELARETVS